MPTWAYVIIGVAAALAVLGVAAWALAQRRSARLRSTFASEYDRTVADAGGRRRAEHELLEREERRKELVIVPLSTNARERYSDQWRATQAEFVDAPERAVREANGLVEEVMAERGYPVSDFEEQAAVISVDHGDVVENYRAAHSISAAAEDGRASTEDLRQAMRHYRSLFEDLLGEAVDTAAAPSRDTEAVQQ